MSFLGTAYPLFFDFLKFSFIFLLFFFFLTGVYSLVRNSKGDVCNSLKINQNSCQLDEMTTYSYFNNASSQTDDMFTYLNLATTFILMIVIIKFRHYHDMTDKKIDTNMISASDFTFMVEKIPLFEKEEEIGRFFEEYSKLYSVKIIKINKAYNIGNYVILKKEKDELLKKQAAESKNLEAYNILKNEIEITQEKINKIEKDFENIENKFTGVAFITVQSEKGLIFFLLT